MLNMFVMPMLDRSQVEAKLMPTNQNDDSLSFQMNPAYVWIYTSDMPNKSFIYHLV